MKDADSIFDLRDAGHFHEKCLQVFRDQYQYNKTYRHFVSELGIQASRVRELTDIPCLPVSFFKQTRVSTGASHAQTVFKSSGTSGKQRSEHHVPDLSLYHRSIAEGFSFFYGNPTDWTILALVPGYTADSSLVHMIRYLMQLSGGQEAFYHPSDPRLEADLLDLMPGRRRILLLGVTHALLSWSQQVRAHLSGVTIMETGGMKGHGRELVREEVHRLLQERLGVGEVHSEYGMTELLSQAYSKTGGLFRTPPWMKVLIRDPYDPLSYMPKGRSGGINIIDLANRHSCSFLETKDIGRSHPNGTFEVLGRFDQSDLRGCNLLFEQ